VKAVKEMKWLL